MPDNLGGSVRLIDRGKTGATAFTGLGIYTYLSGHRQIRQMSGNELREASKLNLLLRRSGINGVALALVGAGLYRLLV